MSEYSKRAGTLEDAGYRFVYSNGEFGWRHPLEVPADAVDLTDVGDDEFELFVARTTGEPAA